MKIILGVLLLSLSASCVDDAYPDVESTSAAVSAPDAGPDAAPDEGRKGGETSHGGGGTM